MPDFDISKAMKMKEVIQAQKDVRKSIKRGEDSDAISPGKPGLSSVTSSRRNNATIGGRGGPT